MTESKMTRREMLIKSAQIFFGGAVFSIGCKKSLRGSLVTKSSVDGFKIGVCDWTLKKEADPTVFELAKKLGIDGVQISLGTLKENMNLREKSIQEKYLEMTKIHEVEIASIAIGELNSVPYKSDPRAETWVLDCIDVCQAMGISVILVPFFGKADLRKDEEGMDRVIKRLKKAAPIAEKAGVILGLESQLNAEEHMVIIDNVGSPAVQVYYDVGNSHRNGYDILKEIRILGKYICEFHAKDYENLYGKGIINFEAIRRAMDDIGYRGWVVMEGDKYPLGLEESLKYDLNYLRDVFPRKV